MRTSLPPKVAAVNDTSKSATRVYRAHLLKEKKAVAANQSRNTTENKQDQIELEQHADTSTAAQSTSGRKRGGSDQGKPQSDKEKIKM